MGLESAAASKSPGITLLVTTAEELLHYLEAQKNSNNIEDLFLQGHLNTLFQTTYNIVFLDVLSIKTMVDLFTVQLSQEKNQTNYANYFTSIIHHTQIIKAFYQRPDIEKFKNKIAREAPRIVSGPQTLYDFASVGRHVNFSPTVRLRADDNPYLTAILALIEGIDIESCKNNGTLVIATLNHFLTTLATKKKQHYNTHIFPLIYIQHTLNQMIPCLTVQTLSKEHIEYLEKQLYFLSMIIQELLPYELRDKMHSKDLKKYTSTLQQKKASSEERHMAYRVLSHAQLPWQDLLNLGRQIHMAKRAEDATPLRDLIRSHLREIIGDVAQLKPLVRTLLKFEIQNYLRPDSFLPEIATTSHLFKTITSLGGYNRDYANLTKVSNYLKGILAHLDNLHSVKGRYAIIRILEVIGEAGKNLSSEITRKDLPFWKQVAKLRNCLSHLQRKGAKKRLVTLMHSTEDQGEIANLMNGSDLKYLDLYIDKLLAALKKYPPAFDDIEPLGELTGVSALLTLLDTTAISQQERLQLWQTSSLPSLQDLVDQKELLSKELLENIPPRFNKDLFLTKVRHLPSLSNKQRKFLTKAHGSRLKGVLLTKSDQDKIRKILGEEKLLSLIDNIGTFTAKRLVEKLEQEFSIQNTKLWLQIHKRLTRARAYLSNESTTKTRSLYTSLQGARAAATGILQTLKELDTLTKPDRSTSTFLFNDFMMNPILYMACEHLISALRDEASAIMATLRFLKDYSIENSSSELNYLCNDLEHDLHDRIIAGNAILHNHDASEIQNFTKEGHYFNIAQHLMTLVDGIPLANAQGQSSERRLTSLQEELSVYKIYLQALLATMQKEPNTDRPMTLDGNLDGTRHSFLEHEITRDHACGFHGLGIDRQHAVNQLLERKNDPHIRSLIAGEIVEAFRSNSLPLHMRTTKINNYYRLYNTLSQNNDQLVRDLNDQFKLEGKARRNAEGLLNYLKRSDCQNKDLNPAQTRSNLQIAINVQNDFEELLNNYAYDVDTYQIFVANYLNPHEWLSYILHSRGLLDALAEINNITVYVWAPDHTSQDPRQLQVVHTSIRQNPANTVHLLHRDNAHFNFLEIIDSAPSRIDTQCNTTEITAGDSDLIRNVYYYSNGINAALL